MIKIIFLKNENRAVIYDGDKEIGECNYIEDEESWNIIHTAIDKVYQGQGLARKIVECVVEKAKANNKKVIADCSYAIKVLKEIGNGN